MYRMKFEASDFDVRIAYNGKQGLELIDEFKPEIVLLDLQMSEMSGEEVLKKVRKSKATKSLKVIILTNTSLEEAPTSLKSLKPLDYIVKAEFTPSQVVDRVKRRLEL